jgi:hypothetical protein
MGSGERSSPTRYALVVARPLRAAAALLAIAVLLGAARRAAADDSSASEEAAAPPSPALLVFGIATAVGGGALQYVAARHFADNVEASAGWLALSGVGGLTSEIGGAVAAYWGWRLGENHFAFDRAAGGTSKERRSLGLTSLGIGAAAFVLEYVAQFYVLTRTITCDTQHILSATSAEHCAADQVLTATVIELAANAIILGVAPVAGYGFGYDAAAKQSASGNGFRLSLAPSFVSGAAGLGLVARF